MTRARTGSRRIRTRLARAKSAGSIAGGLWAFGFGLWVDLDTAQSLKPKAQSLKRRSSRAELHAAAHHFVPLRVPAHPCTADLFWPGGEPPIRNLRAMNGNGSNFAGNHLGVNVAYTKFFFVTPRRDDEATRAKLRVAAGTVGRGFFNDFDAEGRDTPPHETIQFLVLAGTDAGAAPYALQICSKYRPRLKETEIELQRRVGELAEVTGLEGAVRVPQYTSAEMYAYAYKAALPRGSGRVQKNVIIIPMRKSQEWWDKQALDRQTYFYPHTDADGARVKGHARAAEPGISTIYRKLYYNPDGHGRDDEWDFVTYFECADEHLGTFDQICASLRDVRQNPEWRFVTEGPEWRGKRVLRW